MTAVHHPAPENQFYRLDFDEVRKVWVKTTRWNNIINGHNFDSENCMATQGAIALDAHTGGAKKTSPGVIRQYGGDLSGGMGVDDVQRAWDTHFGETLWTPADFSWDDFLYAVRAQRRYGIVGVDYGDVPYDYQVQKGGTFDHAIGVDDWRSTDSRILRSDSLDTKFVWVPQSAYRAAAESLALRVRGSRGKLFVAFSAIRPLLSAQVKYRVVISGYTNLYASPNGARVGAVTAATYICIRSKVGGLWWYQILTKSNGTATANKGRWFKPNHNVTARYA